MTYKFHFLFFLLAIGFFAACDRNDPPLPPVEEPLVADFTTSRPTEPGYIFFPVTFVNKSSVADKYTWNFGDGVTSSDKNPTHTYVQIGTYTVSLTVEKGTESETKTFTLEVKKLTYSFTAGVAQGIGAVLSEIIPNDNGYYVLARKGSYSGAALQFEAFLYSMDISGKVFKTTAFPGVDALLSGATDDSGNLFLCGHKTVGTNVVGSLIKTSPQLNVLFEKTLVTPGINDARLLAITTTPDGGCVAAGYKGTKLWVIKTDGNGDALWENEYPNIAPNSGKMSIIRRPNNGYLVACDINEDQKNGFAVMTINDNGFTTNLQKTLIPGEDIRLGNLVASPNNSWAVTADMESNGIKSLIIQKFAPDGSSEWYKITGGDRSYNGKMHYTSDGGYIVAAQQEAQLVLFRLTESGNIMWERTIPEAESCNQVSNVFQMLDDGFLVGTTTDAVPLGILQITKTDKNGNVE